MLKGTRELSRKFGSIERKLGFRVLSKATRKAATPTLRKMRQRIPVGTEPHKTYTGRTVSGGFAKRSLKLRVRRRIGRGSVRAVLGVLKQAFYVIQFLDRGVTVTSRRKARGRGRLFNRRAKKIKPYRLRGRRWFVRTFVLERKRMENKLAADLRTELGKI